MSDKNGKTDWSKYYSKKKSFFSNFTQKYTYEKIKKVYDSVLKGNNTESKLNVLELGGGNSCFAKRFCEECEVESYDIVDNNELAVKLFECQKWESKVRHKAYLADLAKRSASNKVSDRYDFVYSVGLIEHFTEEERAEVIRAHFKYCKNGGIVLITFPTPTLKYRFWRKLMELIHVWQFHDETPLIYADVSETIEKCGRVLSVELNEKLFLTQMVVVIKKDKG